MLVHPPFSWGLFARRTVELILLFEATTSQSSLGLTTYVLVQSVPEVPKHKFCPGYKFEQPELIAGFTTAS
jgi:hypothetical protein